MRMAPTQRFFNSLAMKAHFFFQNLQVVKQNRRDQKRRDMFMTSITQVIIMEDLVICEYLKTSYLNFFVFVLFF